MNFLQFTPELLSIVESSKIPEDFKNYLVRCFFASENVLPDKVYTYLLILVSKLEFPDQHRLPILIRATHSMKILPVLENCSVLEDGKMYIQQHSLFSVFGNLEIIEVDDSIFRFGMNLITVLRSACHDEIPSSDEIENLFIVESAEGFSKRKKIIKRMDKENLNLYILAQKNRIEQSVNDIPLYRECLTSFIENSYYILNFKNLKENNTYLERCINALNDLDSIRPILVSIKEISDERIPELIELSEKRLEK